MISPLLLNCVEIEVNTRCNRKCDYCPVSVLQPRTQRWMNTKVYERVIGELARINHDGFLSYHFYSEPLLRRDLESLVEYARMLLPSAYQLLYTNGDYLTERRYQSLRDAGIAHFIVTQHDNLRFPERLHQTVVLGRELRLTNRGGLLRNVASSIESLAVPCFAPTDNLLVAFNGDVLLCCDDAERRTVMGNIMESSLDEIWFSDRFRTARTLLAEGKRAKARGICAQCSNTEFRKRGENYYSYLRETVE